MYHVIEDPPDGLGFWVSLAHSLKHVGGDIAAMKGKQANLGDSQVESHSNPRAVS